MEVEGTDIGGSSVAGGSLIMDGEEGTDSEVEAVPVWLNRGGVERR